MKQCAGGFDASPAPARGVLDVFLLRKVTVRFAAVDLIQLAPLLRSHLVLFLGGYHFVRSGVAHNNNRASGTAAK